jgi:hypothetical protein
MPITGSDKVTLQRARTVDELQGWHQSQLEFMLVQVIRKANWPLFLAYYLRGLRPDVREVLGEGWLSSAKQHGIDRAVDEALTIIEEAANG